MIMEVFFNAEYIAIGFGFIKIDRKNGKEYKRIDIPRIQKYIVEAGFGNEFPNVSKEDKLIRGFIGLGHIEKRLGKRIVLSVENIFSLLFFIFFKFL